ncbi:MAG: hypothetical protein LUC86_06920 [Prevotellaceae bacterium]|nr:hypothetical protein [Prevotellaceae bacterium]
MKKIVNGILFLCVLAMLFICWRSIADQQQFDKDVAQHEADVKARLLEIRDAEEAYKSVKNEYCGDWDSLITFINEGAIPLIRKEGTLSDDQMDAGLTEAKVAEILGRGDQAEIEKNGLGGFIRDTTWVSVKDSLFGADYDPSDICYIPHSGDKGGEPLKFDLLAVWIKTKSDAIIPVMECSAGYETFLVGDSKQWGREVVNKTEYAEGQGNFAGLKIGDASLTWNNNAGNWE